MGGGRRESAGPSGRTFMIEVFSAVAVGGLVDSTSQSRSIWCGAGVATGAAMPVKSFRRRRALRQRVRTAACAARVFTSWTAWPQALHGQQHRP